MTSAPPTGPNAQRDQQIRQAEELLFSGPQGLGFAKGLFLGHFVTPWVMPYLKALDDAQRARGRRGRGGPGPAVRQGKSSTRWPSIAGRTSPPPSSPGWRGWACWA